MRILIPSQRVQKMQEIARNTGEPVKAAGSYAELEAGLEEAGFLLSEHLSPTDIQLRYFKGWTDGYRAFENMHFALAAVE